MGKRKRSKAGGVIRRSRSRIRVRSPPRLEKIDAYTMDLFKTSLRKCLEHHSVPFNISLVIKRNPSPNNLTGMMLIIRL